jgi:ABC-2 type transport system ATP-binding protein
VSTQQGVVRVDLQPGDGPACTHLIETAQGLDIRRELARRIVESGYGLLELKQVGMSLEDIYLQLTTSEDTAAETPQAARSEEANEEESI